MSDGGVSRSALPIPDPQRTGLITYDAKDPDTVFPPIRQLLPPKGAPNVLVILIDDAGYGSSSAFGGPCMTPNAEKLAKGGLSYLRFHTTALCSPTRQALLTGRNHHSVGMGGITEIASGSPGYCSVLPNNAAPLAAAAGAVFGPSGRAFLIAATALSIVGYLAADILCSPRTLFAMAQRRQLPRTLARVDPRFDSPAVAICVYAASCATLACTGSFQQLVIAATSGTLMLYLICCVAVLPLRARDVATHGTPFVAPGGTLVPLAGSAIIVWLLSTLMWMELASALAVAIAAAVVYAVREMFAERAALIAEI